MKSTFKKIFVAWGFIIFFLLICSNYMWILGMNLLLIIFITNIFPKYVTWHFSF